MSDSKWKINADEIRTAVSALYEPGEIFEVRIIGTENKRDVMSGYFRDAETLIRELSRENLTARNVYITLNKINADCFARTQRERFKKNVSTTSDSQITEYHWLFIDLDPERAADISSTREEIEEAKELAYKILAYMDDLGFSKPIMSLSGNGVHLLYKIRVPCDNVGKKLISDCLNVLSILFTSSKIKVDTTNSNPARICKLYGTLAQKGADTPDRPHRMSHIAKKNLPVQVTGREVLEKLAAELPPVPDAGGDHRGSYSGKSDFDIQDFMNRHGLTASRTKNNGEWTIHYLDVCPFNPDHTDGDARIFVHKSGAIGFKCHHNGCKGKNWEDVRLKYEPDAYDFRAAGDRIDRGWEQHSAAKYDSNNGSFVPTQERQICVPELKTISTRDLLKADIPVQKWLIDGLIAEEQLVLLASPRKLGKSWLANQIANAIASGAELFGRKAHKASVLYADMESNRRRPRDRLKKQLAGKEPPDGLYITTSNDGLQKIGEGFEEQIRAKKEEIPDLKLIIIDVLQTVLKPSPAGMDKYEWSYEVLRGRLKKLCDDLHVAIIAVMHTRKGNGNGYNGDDPLDSVLGSVGITSAADSIMVLTKDRKTGEVWFSSTGKDAEDIRLCIQFDKGNCTWKVLGDAETMELQKLDQEYEHSPITATVRALVKQNDGSWEGSATDIKEASKYIGKREVIDVVEQISKFINKHEPRFWAVDNLKVESKRTGKRGRLFSFLPADAKTDELNEEEKK